MDEEQPEHVPLQHVPQPPHPYGIPDEHPSWFTQFLNMSLSFGNDARQARCLGEQNSEGIARINERVDVIEQHQVDWAFRYNQSSWQGNEYDPNNYPPTDDFARISNEIDFSLP